VSTKSKKTFGIGVLVLGAILVVLSFIIKAKVEEGEGQIARGKESVEKGQGLFSLSPYTKKAGDQVFSGANQKIAAGEEDVAYYTAVAQFMLYAGIAAIVIGGGCIFFNEKSAR
jgi:hypothetical protein